MTNCCFLHMFLCTVFCPSKLYMPISHSSSFILPLPPSSSSSSSLSVNPTKQAYAFFSSIPHISLSLTAFPLSRSLCLCLWGGSYSPYLTETGHPQEGASDFHNWGEGGGAHSGLLHCQNLQEKRVWRERTQRG